MAAPFRDFRSVRYPAWHPPLSDSKSEAYRALSGNERRQVSLLFLPILFGPLYYFAKTMWQKGLVLLGVGFLIGVVMELVEYSFSFNFPTSTYGLPLGFLCASLAGYDYYKHVEYGEKMWPGMPGFMSHPVGLAAFPLLAFMMLVGTTGYTDRWDIATSMDDGNASAVGAVSGVWVDGNRDLVAISLNQEGGTLHTPVDLFMVTVSGIAWGEDSVSVALAPEDSDTAAWVLEQTYEAEGRFMQLYDSATDTVSRLDFVDGLNVY